MKIAQNLKLPGIICLFILILYSCKSEQTQSVKSVTPKDSVVSVSFNPPTLTEQDYRELFQYQQNIIVNPDSREEKEQFIQKAYSPAKNTLITFGCARKINPETKQPIAHALIKRAALLDSKRWASYGLLWIKNDFQPDFGKITEINSGLAQEVFSFDSGDSLVIALASKVH